MTDALRTSLAEQLTRMRGSGEFPAPLRQRPLVAERMAEHSGLDVRHLRP